MIEVKKSRKPRKKKERQPPEPHWKSCYGIAIAFFVAKFGESAATLIKGSPRELKAILGRLRANAAVVGNCDWTKDLACRTLFYFLEFAWQYEIDGLLFPKNREFFLTYTNKYKEQILEQIHLFKLQKTKANEIQDFKGN